MMVSLEEKNRSYVFEPNDRHFLTIVITSFLLICWFISRFQPWWSPDSQSYLDAARASDIWAQSRHPLFGWMIDDIERRGRLDLAVWVQVTAFIVAIIMLHVGLRRLGVSFLGRAAVTLCLVFSNSGLIWHNAVHPELIATASLLASLACLAFLASVNRGRIALMIAYGFFIGIAFILRPSFLPAIVLFPLLLIVWTKTSRGQYRFAFAAIVFVVGLSPFVANATWRKAVVRDFNIVSFGGFQASGMTGLMLTESIIERLSPQMRPLASAILQARIKGEAEGRILATPVNSVGNRSFVSAAVGYYDIYARSYDALLYGPISSLRGDLGWVEFNRRLMQLSIEIIAAAPDRYAAWLVGGSARFVGRATVTNLPFMLFGIGMIAAIAISLIMRGDLPKHEVRRRDLAVLVPFVGIYTIASGCLSVVMTFPASRYIDTAAMLLPALIALPALSMWHLLFKRTTLAD